MAPPGAIRHAQMAPPRTAPRAELAYDGIRPGLSTVVPPGAYTGTTAWPSPEIFLKGLAECVAADPDLLRGKPNPETGRCKDQISRATFMAVMTVYAASADFGTGRAARGVKAQIAAKVGCSPTSVQRAMRFAERMIGCLLTVTPGQCLTRDHRIGPQGVHTRGRLKQRGVPPVRAFTVCARLRPFVLAAAITPPPVHNLCTRGTPSDLQGHDAAHQPDRAHFHSNSYLTDRFRQTTRASLRSPNGPGSARLARIRAKRPPPGRQLARDLVKAAPLLRSTSPKRLEHALKRFAESRPVWTATDLLDAFSTIRQRAGLPAGLPSEPFIETPWAYIVSLLAQLDEHDDHPRLYRVDQAELRCGRRECDHGWENVTDPAGRPAARRCPHCRPGAWPEHTLDDFARFEMREAFEDHVERFGEEDVALGFRNIRVQDLEAAGELDEEPNGGLGIREHGQRHPPFEIIESPGKPGELGRR